MINWETILSEYKNKPTLLQFLIKVKKALENASLENVELEKPTNNSVIFNFKFADGTTIKSNELIIDSAIEELTKKIDSEATTRANADTSLESKITSEATTRANADTSLETKINNLAIGTFSVEVWE